MCLWIAGQVARSEMVHDRTDVELLAGLFLDHKWNFSFSYLVGAGRRATKAEQNAKDKSQS